MSHSLVLMTSFPCPPAFQVTFINRLPLFQIFSGLALLQKHPRVSLTSPVIILITDLIPKNIVVTDLVLGAFVLLIHAAVCCLLRIPSCSCHVLFIREPQWILDSKFWHRVPPSPSVCHHPSHPPSWWYQLCSFLLLQEAVAKPQNQEASGACFGHWDRN